MGLPSHIEKIQEVSELASKEFAIEMALKKMKEEWAPLQLQVSVSVLHFVEGKGVSNDSCQLDENRVADNKNNNNNYNSIKKMHRNLCMEGDYHAHSFVTLQWS